MSDLNREDFERILTQKLDTLEKNIIQRIDESQEDLARMVAAGFENMRERLDVTERVTKHETAIRQLAKKMGLKLDF